MHVVLYTRTGCHLCDDVDQLLRERGIEVEHVDIDSDPDLTEQFGTIIPVVSIDGKERFRGRVNSMLLDRLLHQLKQQP